MAIIHYDSIDADFLKVKFRCCECGNEMNFRSEELSSVKEGFIDHVQDSCGHIYEIVYKDSSMNIVGLPDKNILSTHPIEWEYDWRFDMSFVTALMDKTIIENSIEEVSKLDRRCMAYLYEAIWCKIISMLDIYCHYTIAKQVLSNDETWESFAKACGKHEEGMALSRDYIKGLFKKPCFRSMHNIPKMFKHGFGLDVNDLWNKDLKEAIEIRNWLTHNQGYSSDGEKQVVTKEKLLKLSKAVWTFISNTDKNIRNYEFNKQRPQMMAIHKQSENYNKKA